MDPILDELGQAATRLAHAAPRVPWACGLSGELVTESGPGYWVRQAREPVRFADAVATLAAQEISVFIEIGPDGTLSALGPAAVGEDPALEFVPLLRPGQPGPAAVTTALARVHGHGAAVNWAAVLGSGRRVDLPTYAFQHERFWPQPVPPGPSQDRTEAWRYRITWTPVPEPDQAALAGTALAGTWLVVTGPGPADGLADGSRRALEARGARVVPVRTATHDTERAQLSALLTTLPVAAGDVSGVISLLALDETPLPGHRVVPAGLAGTLALVQALGDAGIDAPLWLLTRGAVAAEPGEVLASPVQGRYGAWAGSRPRSTGTAGAAWSTCRPSSTTGPRTGSARCWPPVGWLGAARTRWRSAARASWPGGWPGPRCPGSSGRGRRAGRCW